MPVLYYARGSGGTFGLTGAGTLESRRLAVIGEARRLQSIAKAQGRGPLVTELAGWIMRMAKNFIGPNLTQVVAAETRIRAIGTLLTVVAPVPPGATLPAVLPPSPSGPAPGTPAVLPPEGASLETPRGPAYPREEPPQVYYPPGEAGDALAAAGISPMMLGVGVAAVVVLVLVLRRKR